MRVLIILNWILSPKRFSKLIEGFNFKEKVFPDL